MEDCNDCTWKKSGSQARCRRARFRVRYEAKKTGKSKSRVKRAVKKVGNSRRKVERERSRLIRISSLRLALRRSSAPAKQRGRPTARLKSAEIAPSLRKPPAIFGTGAQDVAVLGSPADQSRQTVQFGSTVTIVREARKQTFQIVGEDEAEPANGKLSYVSPLARTIMNKEVGDTATLGDSEIAIAAVSADEVASDHAADRSD